MARTDTLENYLTDVASAIKEKKGDSTPILASDFDIEIENLPSGGSDLDWSAIGYNETPTSIQTVYNEAKNIYDNWNPSTTSMKKRFDGNNNILVFPLINTSSVTTMENAFSHCYSLHQIPLLNTSNVKSFKNAFTSCYSLEIVPLLDTSRATNLSSMFFICDDLSDESLDNILQMCINATSYTGTKSLSTLGFSTTFQPASRIQALPHYQDFVDAGWTIGY